MQGSRAAPDGAKISLVFSTASDGPGSLMSILQLFGKHKINLTRIESRPAMR